MFTMAETQNPYHLCFGTIESNKMQILSIPLEVEYLAETFVQSYLQGRPAQESNPGHLFRRQQC